MATILIVDADGARRTQLGLACLRAGHAIVIAHSGAEALAWVAAAAPDRLSGGGPPPAALVALPPGQAGGRPEPGPAA